MISIKCCGKTYEVLGVGVVSFVAVAGAELGRRLDGVGPRVARRSGAADALLAPAALGVLLRRPPVHDAGQFVVVAGQRHQLRFVFEFHPSVLLFVCFFSFWVCVRWCVCFFFGRSRKRRRCAQKLGGKRNAVMADRDCAGSGPFSSNRRREQGKKTRKRNGSQIKTVGPFHGRQPSDVLVCVVARHTHTHTHTHTHRIRLHTRDTRKSTERHTDGHWGRRTRRDPRGHTRPTWRRLRCDGGPSRRRAPDGTGRVRGDCSKLFLGHRVSGSRELRSVAEPQRHWTGTQPRSLLLLRGTSDPPLRAGPVPFRPLGHGAVTEFIFVFLLLLYRVCFLIVPPGLSILARRSRLVTGF